MLAHLFRVIVLISPHITSTVSGVFRIVQCLRPYLTGACPGIRKGGGCSFLLFSIFQGGGPAQKIAEKMILSTKKVAKYR